jgi:hypothetical protein
MMGVMIQKVVVAEAVEKGAPGPRGGEGWDDAWRRRKR